MPEVYRDEKQREFLTLRQRTMTVAKYEVRFTQLSHYAPMIVATERDRCRRFEEGLNYEIRDRLTPGDLRSYQDLRAVAVRAERLQRERERIMASRKSKRNDGRQGRSDKRQRQRSYTQSQGRADRSGSGAVSHRREDRVVAKDQQPPHRKKPLCAQCGRPHSGVCRQEQEDVIYMGSRDTSNVSVRNRRRRVHQYPRP